MGKTTYSRNPSTSKGRPIFIQSPRAQVEISEYISKIPIKLQTPLKD
mgnify:CR=1